jgi:hypothetical protein
VADQQGGRALTRISRADLDLRFRSQPERVLLWGSHYLRRTGRGAVVVGCWSWGIGMAMALVMPRWAWPPMAAGLLAIVLGSAVRLTGAIVAAPLGWLRSWRLRRSDWPGAVTLRGRVRPRRTIRSPQGREVVAYRARFTRKGQGPEVEKAEPFLLDDGGPEPALIAVEHLYLAGAPYRLEFFSSQLPAEGLHLLPSMINVPTQYEEIGVEPGDTVEATGWIEDEVDPSLDTAFRQVPVRRVLRGRADIPLVVRRVDATDDDSDDAP